MHSGNVNRKRATSKSHPTACQVCTDKANAINCSHCLSCGGSNYYARDCRAKGGHKLGNPQRLVLKDKHWPQMMMNSLTICVTVVTRLRVILSSNNVKVARLFVTVQKDAKRHNGKLMRKHARPFKNWRIPRCLSVTSIQSSMCKLPD